MSNSQNNYEGPGAVRMHFGGVLLQVAFLAWGYGFLAEGETPRADMIAQYSFWSGFGLIMWGALAKGMNR